MALTAGTRLGCYEIVGSIGAGGMGEVYRARDTKLARDVAVKVLPALFSSDPERLARFTREAHTLAALNHPNIAHIHGIEDSGSVRALVMELVEGEDLRERLERGAIPLAEALPIARQIADALEAAHERGIVHRDLKPANIKLTDDGRVKVLDFGLAKALDPVVPPSQSDGMNSPTFSMRATAMGTILGTAAYMAPEQAKGKAVDRRADVWAFGVVLYEMLAGRRAFDGADTSEVMVAVLRDTPPFDALPAATPPSIHRLLRRSLEKDRAKRLDSMAAARLEIDDALVAPEGSHTAADARAPVRRVPPIALAWTIAGLAIASLLGTIGLMRPWRVAAAPEALRLSAELGFEGWAVFHLNRTIAIAPDGKAVVFSGRQEREERPRLYYRRLDELKATPISGTEDGVDPFFSPDGQWIGFFTPNKLHKASITGGAVVTLADVLAGRGATWGEDDVITFTPFPTPGGQVMRIPAGGGTPVALGPMIEGHVTQRWPQVLPGNTAVIYTGLNHVDNFEQACLVAHPLPSGTPKLVTCGGFGWRYVDTGHVLFVHKGTLFAQPFDPKAFSVSGNAVPIVQGVMANAASGAANFAVAPNGLLVYLPGRETASIVALEEIDRAGTAKKLALAPQDWQALAYSPDGRRLALEIAASGNTDIWVYDTVREALTRLTFSDVPDAAPVWTRDGRHIVYASAQGGPPNLFWKPADGSGAEQRLIRTPLVQFPTSWDPTGRNLLITQQSQSTGFDILVVPIDGDSATGLKAGDPHPFVATPAFESFGTFSPDGKWVAYTSDESSRFEVYVRGFHGGGRWQVSTEGGAWPVWSRTANELLFGTVGGTVMSVKYEVDGDSFSPGRPEPWNKQPMLIRSTAAMYALHPDGKRLVGSLLANQPDARTRSFVVVTNIFDELRRLSPR